MKRKPDLFGRSEPPDEMTDVECYVLGGGDLGADVARRLSADGYTTAIVDESYDSSDLPGTRGDPADLQVLTDAGLSDTSTVVVATRLDRRNVLIAQLVSVHFDVSEVLVLANVPDRYDLLADAGHEPVCATTVLSEALAEKL